MRGALALALALLALILINALQAAKYSAAATTTPAVTTTTTTTATTWEAAAIPPPPSEMRVDWWSPGVVWEGVAEGAAAKFCVERVEVVRYGLINGWSLFLSGTMAGKGFVFAARPQAGKWFAFAERWWGGYDSGAATIGSGNITCLWLFVEVRDGALHYGFSLGGDIEAAYKTARWFFSARGAQNITWAAASLAGFGSGDWIDFNGTVYIAMYVKRGRWEPAPVYAGLGGVVESVAHAWVKTRGNCGVISWPEKKEPVCP